MSKLHHLVFFAATYHPLTYQLAKEANAVLISVE